MNQQPHSANKAPKKIEVMSPISGGFSGSDSECRYADGAA